MEDSDYIDDDVEYVDGITYGEMRKQKKEYIKKKELERITSRNKFILNVSHKFLWELSNKFQSGFFENYSRGCEETFYREDFLPDSHEIINNLIHNIENNISFTPTLICKHDSRSYDHELIIRKINSNIFIINIFTGEGGAGSDAKYEIEKNNLLDILRKTKNWL